MTTFREILFKQQAYWVSELNIDSLVPSVSMQLICNPRTNEKECDVVFSPVSEVKVHYYGEEDDSKDEYLCALIDISDKIENGKHFYFIATDTVEVSFQCEIAPQIIWENPSKQYQTWEEEKLDLEKNA